MVRQQQRYLVGGTDWGIRLWFKDFVGVWFMAVAK